jgi:DNA-binding NarL/FixJ family response regulator
LRQPRSYRPARSPDEAARALRDAARAGHVDADATEAVLAAAGHAARKRRSLPAGLTAREVEVLRLAALGRSNREISRALLITEKTTAHHIQHVYDKIGVSTRGAAALFAVQHGLLPDVSAEDG